MSIKMKGLFKGLRYISQIFEEDKEEEMQIGLPTDVKHVAHIGMDGPSLESPSWMKEFKSPTNSGPLNSGNDNNKDDPETISVSDDSKKGSKLVGRDLPEVPRSSRRHHAGDGESPKKKAGSTKSRSSRRSDSKESLEGSVRSVRASQELGTESESPLPEIPKKSRKKKSEGGSTRSRSKPVSLNSNDHESAAGGINGEEEEERRMITKEEH